MVSESDVMQSLGDVEDPEMKMSVTELGLIYAIRIEEQEEGTHAEIDMTLTSPGCPVAPEIMSASHHVPNRLPNLFVAATVASQTTPGHQKGLPSLILDSVWEPIWLQIGDSGPLREPYYLLCFHHKNTLRARPGSQQNSHMHP